MPEKNRKLRTWTTMVRVFNGWLRDAIEIDNAEFDSLVESLGSDKTYRFPILKSRESAVRASIERAREGIKNA